MHLSIQTKLDPAKPVEKNLFLHPLVMWKTLLSHHHRPAVAALATAAGGACYAITRPSSSSTTHCSVGGFLDHDDDLAAALSPPSRAQRPTSFVSINATKSTGNKSLWASGCLATYIMAFTERQGKLLPSRRSPKSLPTMLPFNEKWTSCSILQRTGGAITTAFIVLYEWKAKFFSLSENARDYRLETKTQPNQDLGQASRRDGHNNLTKQINQHSKSSNKMKAITLLIIAICMLMQLTSVLGKPICKRYCEKEDHLCVQICPEDHDECVAACNQSTKECENACPSQNLRRSLTLSTTALVACEDTCRKDYNTCLNTCAIGDTQCIFNCGQKQSQCMNACIWQR